MTLRQKIEAKYTIVEAAPLLSLDFIKETATKLADTWKKGKHEGDNAKFNQYIKKNSQGDLKTFADSAIDYFKKGKIKWDEFGWFQGEYAPGFDIIPWSYLKRALSDIPPAIENEMPKAFQQKLQGA